jgi:1,4-dihydroxy-2-naphthoate octaprenyltransferase
MSVSDIRPGSPRAWLLASRPQTLLVGIVPVVVGTAIAHGQGGFHLRAALAALLGAVAIQLGTNFANDLFDFKQGADTDERVGPPRAAQLGLLSTRALAVGMAICFAFATFVGTYLVARSGWPIVVIGVLSILSGIAYTGGPYPLGYNGLGDLFVFVFFGPVAVGGTAYVQLGALPTVALVAAVPVGALATAVLVVNNTRDEKTDVRCGKRTLVVRFGHLFGVVEYALLLLSAYVAAALIPLLDLGSPWALLPWLSAPLALRLASRIARDEGAALNPSLGATARLLAIFGLLFAIGLAM